MPGLFEPLTIRSVEFRNRAWVSPMCMYSATDGVPNNWHLVHLGSMARGGAGLVIAEATGVLPEGRITPGCLGMWSTDHVRSMEPITAFIESMGAVAGIQLGHSGRKGSTGLLWEGGAHLPPENGGWLTGGPSAIGFGDLPVPQQMTVDDIATVVDAFAMAAVRSLAAGFRVIEIHAAHGYLLHEFMSPLSNRRGDEYGGSIDNRIRFTMEVIRAVRAAIGEGTPLFVRVSAIDWLPGGWDLEDTVYLATRLREEGVDLIDCSSGALASDADIDVAEGYQVPFARAVREGAGVATAAVGLITRPTHADQIIRDGSADAVLLAREMLRNPHWPLMAAEELGCSMPWPKPYSPAARPSRVRVSATGPST